MMARQEQQMIKLELEQTQLAMQLRQLQMMKLELELTNMGSQDNLHKQFLEVIVTMGIRILDMMDGMKAVNARLEFLMKEIEEMEEKQEKKPPPPPPPPPAGA
jgi:hypothetical protein